VRPWRRTDSGCCFDHLPGVVGVAPPSHRADQAMLGEQLAVDLGGVLRPSDALLFVKRRCASD
jgi:hypothetical protein